MALGCGAGNRPITPGEANALTAAQAWLTTQGVDPNSAELQAEAEGNNWSMHVEYLPRTPGGHTLLRIDSDGKVIEVFPGA